MNAHSRSLRLITRLLVVLRILTVPFGLCAVWIAWRGDPTTLTLSGGTAAWQGGSTSMSLSGGSFALTSGVEVVLTDANGLRFLPNATFPPDDFAILPTTGVLELSGQAADALRTYFRWGMFPIVLLLPIAGFWILTLGLRLCRNVGAGRTFAEENIRQLRRIGIALIVFTIALSLAQIWFAHFTSGPTADLIGSTLANARLMPPGSTNPAEALDSGRHFHFHINMAFLFSGLSFLALGEVFLQGLRLQRDADLTV